MLPSNHIKTYISHNVKFLSSRKRFKWKPVHHIVLTPSGAFISKIRVPDSEFHVESLLLCTFPCWRSGFSPPRVPSTTDCEIITYSSILPVTSLLLFASLDAIYKVLGLETRLQISVPLPQRLGDEPRSHLSSTLKRADTRFFFCCFFFNRDSSRIRHK